MIPPPPPLSLDMVDDEALGSVLISWYMSGYHTGYYLVCALSLVCYGQSPVSTCKIVCVYCNVGSLWLRFLA